MRWLRLLTISVIVILSSIYVVYGIEDSSKEQIICSDDIASIAFSVNITPIKNSKYCYDCIFDKKVEIEYIMRLLNSFILIDDNEVINGGDIPIVNIYIKVKNGTAKNIGFISSRYFDSTGKQYAIDKNEYNRFLDFIYALKAKKVILDDEITFEPSEWARSYVDEAVKNELVPELHQINYRGKINRLEVCQLIDNLLNQQNFAKTESTENPFCDTTDKSVISLYNLGIIDGKNASEFAPYDYVTREELSKILSNTYYLMNPKVQPDNCTHEYADQEEISYWALNYVGDMYSLNIMIGNPENEFKPHANVTKEELIITLLRIYK